MFQRGRVGSVKRLRLLLKARSFALAKCLSVIDVDLVHSALLALGNHCIVVLSVLARLNCTRCSHIFRSLRVLLNHLLLEVVVIATDRLDERTDRLD